MGLDKVIIKHLDEMDKIEEAIDKDIEKLYKMLDIDVLMQEPEEVLGVFVTRVQNILEDKYFPEAAKKGIEFAEKVKADGSIEVEKSNNPNLNKELIDKNNV